MTNFIKFYHFIISSLIIFIMIGFVSNTALTQRNVGLGERMKNAFLFPFRVVSIPIGGAISLAGGATRELKSLLSSTPITTKEEFEAILNDADKSHRSSKQSDRCHGKQDRGFRKATDPYCGRNQRSMSSRECN